MLYSFILLLSIIPTVLTSGPACSKQKSNQVVDISHATRRINRFKININEIDNLQLILKKCGEEQGPIVPSKSATITVNVENNMITSINPYKIIDDPMNQYNCNQYEKDSNKIIPLTKEEIAFLVEITTIPREFQSQEIIHILPSHKYEPLPNVKRSMQIKYIGTFSN